MLETFKARLKVLYPGVNLSKTRIDAIADRLHKKFPDLTEEPDHDARLNDLNDLTPFDETAKTDDKVRTLENKPAPAPKPDDKPKPDEKPKSEIDELKELVKGLATSVQTLTQEKQTQTMKEKVTAHEKLKGIDPKLYSLVPLPAKDEDIDSWVDNVAGVYGRLETVQQDENKSFIPGIGKRGKTEHKPSDKELDNILSNVKI